MAGATADPGDAAVVRRVLSQHDPLSDAEWAAVRPRLRRQALAARQVVLRAGDICRELVFVERGVLRYFLAGDGTEFTGTFFFEGSVAADYGSFVSQAAARQWIDAIEDSVVWFLSHADVQRLYASSATWERRGRRIAEAVLVAAQRRTAAFVLEDAESRYAALFAERPKVLERLPQYMIASYLGITPEALSRIRRRRARGA